MCKLGNEECIHFLIAGAKTSMGQEHHGEWGVGWRRGGEFGLYDILLEVWDKTWSVVGGAVSHKYSVNWYLAIPSPEIKYFKYKCVQCSSIGFVPMT